MNVLMPLPSYGFDPTEAAIPWKILSQHKHQVFFCTPNGKMAKADTIMLTGKGLGIWKGFLRARNDARKTYAQMEKNIFFTRPLTYKEVCEIDFDVLFLPGGHDKGVKEYLESEILQKLIADFFTAQKPVAAVCHGPLLVARSIHPATGKSVIYDFKTTALLKRQERLAYNLTKFWLGDYYLTYPRSSVEDEIKSLLKNEKNFITGPIPLLKDRAEHLNRGFSVKDRNYLSARWPGDIYHLSFSLLEVIRNFNGGA